MITIDDIRNVSAYSEIAGCKIQYRASFNSNELPTDLQADVTKANKQIGSASLNSEGKILLNLNNNDLTSEEKIAVVSSIITDSNLIFNPK